MNDFRSNKSNCEAENTQIFKNLTQSEIFLFGIKKYEYRCKLK